MKDKILEILLDKIICTPHEFYPTGIEGLPQSASEIADMFQKYVRWKDEYCTMITKWSNKEPVILMFEYLIHGQGTRYTIDELFLYWHDKIYKTEER